MIKSAFIYLFGSVLNRAIPFFLLPVLTRYLAPNEFGLLAIFQVFLSFTTPFVGMNMHNNISRNFAKMDRDEMAQLIGTLSGLLCVSASLVGLFAAGWVSSNGVTLGMPGGWLLVLPLVAALSMAHQFNLTVLRNQERPLMFGGYQVGNTALNVGVSLALVVGLGYGWQGRAAGVAFSSACFGFVGLVALRRQKLLTFRYDGKLFRQVLIISLPLIPHAVGGVVIAMSDRLFIDRMVSKEAVGLYAVGYTFGMIVNLVVEAFNRAWSPWFYREMYNATEQTRRRIVKFSYVYFAGISLLAVAISGISYFALPYMVGSVYQTASQFIIWVALGYAFRGMYTMVFPYLVHSGKTGFLGIGTFFTASINIALNYVLIKTNGAIGAAQATVVSFAILFILTWIYSARICPMPWTIIVKKG